MFIGFHYWVLFTNSCQRVLKACQVCVACACMRECMHERLHVQSLTDLNLSGLSG